VCDLKTTRVLLPAFVGILSNITLISYFIIKLNIYSYNFGTKIKVEDKTTDWF